MMGTALQQNVLTGTLQQMLCCISEKNGEVMALVRPGLEELEIIALLVKRGKAPILASDLQGCR